MPTSLLYALTVLIWGSSWYAMEMQLVLPGDLAVTYRYILAAAILVGFCLATRRRLRFSSRDHLYMAIQGVTLFGVNYLLFYWAAHYLVSGLLAVCFSTIVVMNILNIALFFRQRVDRLVAGAAALGLVGIGLVFWPEVGRIDLSVNAAIGLGLSIVATYAASLGNMVTLRHKAAGIPVIEANAMGMSYGAAFCLAVVLIQGREFTFNWTAGYLGSLVYLALFASVIGFGCYLTLVQRIGADRAAYVTVLFPVVALGMSTWLEGYSWTTMAAAGVALVLLGNLLVLRRRAPRSAATDSTG